MAGAGLEIDAPAGEPGMRFRRWVAAPPEVVFSAWTSPDQLRHWWGPARNTLEECEVDLRTGGRHRYLARNDDGMEFRFHGEFLEVEPPRRLVSTWTFEGEPGVSTIDTLEFTAADGGTLVTGESRVESIELRDRRLADERMLDGMRETWERLDAFLAAGAPAGG